MSCSLVIDHGYYCVHIHMYKDLETHFLLCVSMQEQGMEYKMVSWFHVLTSFCKYYFNFEIPTKYSLRPVTA